MKDQTIGIIVLAGCITAIQITAFAKGVDGQVLALTSSILTGILAYFIGKKKK